MLRDEQLAAQHARASFLRSVERLACILRQRLVQQPRRLLRLVLHQFDVGQLHQCAAVVGLRGEGLFERRARLRERTLRLRREPSRDQQLGRIRRRPLQRPLEHLTGTRHLANAHQHL